MQVGPIKVEESSTIKVETSSHGSPTSVLAPERALCEVTPLALPDAAELDAPRKAALAAELEALRGSRCVSRLPDEECPICLADYPETPFPVVRVPRGAFMCCHAVCRPCIQRLLVVSAEAVGRSMPQPVRCPLCRAEGVRAADAPPWYRVLLESDEVVAARAAAKQRFEDSGPAAVHMAAATAAQNIAALHRLIFGSAGAGAASRASARGGTDAGAEGDAAARSDGWSDEQAVRLQAAVQAASEVVVEVSEEGEDDDGFFSTFDEAAAEEELQREAEGAPETTLMMMTADESLQLEAAQTEALDAELFGGPPGERVSAFMALVANAYFGGDPRAEATPSAAPSREAPSRAATEPRASLPSGARDGAASAATDRRELTQSGIETSQIGN
jgi:hypothetical protein